MKCSVSEPWRRPPARACCASTASLGSSNSLRHALSGLLTSAPGFASPRGLQEREPCSLIRGNRPTPTPHPDHIRNLLAVGSPPLSPTRSAPRRAVARHYCHVWENVLKIIPKYGKTTKRSIGENIGPGGHPKIERTGMIEN